MQAIGLQNFFNSTTLKDQIWKKWKSLMKLYEEVGFISYKNRAKIVRAYSSTDNFWQEYGSRSVQNKPPLQFSLLPSMTKIWKKISHEIVEVCMLRSNAILCRIWLFCAWPLGIILGAQWCGGRRWCSWLVNLFSVLEN